MTRHRTGIDANFFRQRGVTDFGESFPHVTEHTSFKLLVALKMRTEFHIL